MHLIFLVVLLGWDLVLRRDPRSIYCISLMISTVIYVAIWISAICNLPDAVLIGEHFLLRISFSAAMLSRGCEELMGRVKISRKGESLIFHWALGIGSFAWAFYLLASDHTKSHSLCERTRDYFAGRPSESDPFLTEGQGEDAADRHSKANRKQEHKSAAYGSRAEKHTSP